MDLKHRKKRFLFWLAALSAAALLSGCKAADSADTGVSEKAFGVDYMQELSVENAEQIVCTQTDTWIVTTAKNDFIYRVDHTQETEEIEKVEWQQQEGESLLSLTERNGTLYISVWLAEEDTIEIRKRYTDGSFQTVMQTEATDTGWYVVGSGLFVDGDGSIYLAGRNGVTRFTKDGTPDFEYQIGAGSGFFTENSDGNTDFPAVAQYVAGGADGITLYELNGKKAEKKWTLKASAMQIYDIRSSNADTLCLSAGDRLLFIDRESGNLLAQSELVMMGMLSVRTGFYDAEMETLRLCGESGGNPGKLSLGSLSKRDASAEQRTELIYGTCGMNNDDAPDRIKKAIMEFNQSNENYYVTIRVYSGDYFGERLQADMASGNAPDLIELMSMSPIWANYETYIRNGYLENLSPFLKQSEYKDDIIWNVLNAFELDNGLYLLTPQFTLKGILIHPEYECLVKEWNTGSFLELLEKNKWEKNIFSAGSSEPDLLLYSILAGKKEDFIDWEQRTASFETEEFTTLLALCKEYGEQDWPSGLDIANTWSPEERYQYTLCNPVWLDSFTYYLDYTDFYGREYPIHGSPAASGQAYEVQTSFDACGIYAGSKNKEGAWEFLESLLEDSHQKWFGGTNYGFPILNSVLREQADEAKDIEYTTSNKNKIKISDGEISIIEDIIYNGKLVRGTLNSDIWKIVEEETASYFAGDRSAEEVAHIIQSRVEIVLNE